MFGVTTSDDYRPVAWMGRYPVDVTTMLVGVHVVCAVLACILTAIPGLGGTLNYFVFDSARIWNGLQIWRLGTYAFVHFPSGLLWFAIEMYLLFVFGREVERFVGRRCLHFGACGNSRSSPVHRPCILESLLPSPQSIRGQSYS
jgi:hypothetical protein